jgi:Flp pilus assembly protein TadG
VNPSTRHGEQGAATTTLVLILPVVLLTVMVVVQLALAYHARQVVTAAAQDAALAATAQGADADIADTTARHVLDRAGAGLLHDPNVAVTADADRVHVTVSGNVASVVPGMEFTVTGTSDSPTEHFRPQEPAP